MPTLTENTTLGDALKWEQAGSYSRLKITVVSGQNLENLAVVGKITANGKYTRLAPAASDGSQNAAGFLIGAVDASSADKEGVIIEKDALVAFDNLSWPNSITSPQKDAAIAAMTVLGIKAVSLA